MVLVRATKSGKRKKRDLRSQREWSLHMNKRENRENWKKRGELRPIIAWIPVEKADPTDYDDNGRWKFGGSMDIQRRGGSDGQLIRLQIYL